MKMKKMNISILLGVLALLSIVLSACGPETPTIDINAERTGFAQTANVQATMTSQAQPTPTETPVPSPTFTPTQEISPTSAATTSVVTTAAPISGNDAGVWIANDPPDNTVFSPGEAFTVTWTLENTGTSTWTTNYYLKFSSGEQMGAVDEVFLPYDVPPGTNVKVSVDFIAPENEGEKQSNWQLVNANDQSFYEFWVIIEVSKPAEE
jgi:hypothetical protein